METEGTQEREEEIGDSKKHGQRVLCTWSINIVMKASTVYNAS